VLSKEALLSQLWSEFDVNGDNKMDIKEVAKVLQKINYNCDKKTL
jgi:Ca2+-binding EF-hand superfamily protein